MKIDSKTITTRVHSAVATADDLKGVAILAVKRQLGLSDDAVVSADARPGDDGAIVVEVVEAVPAETPKPTASTAPTPAI